MEGSEDKPWGKALKEAPGGGGDAEAHLDAALVLQAALLRQLPQQVRAHQQPANKK